MITLGRAPGGLPLLGHVLSFARHPLEFLPSLREHGDLVEIRVGPKKAYVPCHPEAAAEVLRASATFDKGGIAYDKGRILFGNGLATCDHAHHRTLRPLMQPAFGRARLETYTRVMHEEVTALVDSWEPGQTVDVKHALDALYCRITARALFSADLGTAAVTEIQQSLPIIVDGVFHRMMDPTGLLGRIPTATNRRYDRAGVRLLEASRQVIAHYRSSDQADHGDILSMLLAARDEQTGEGFTDHEIHEQVMTVMTGGTETTSTGISWTLDLLRDHPEVEQRLRDELDALGGRLPGLAETATLDYTRRVFTEALRLFPPAWLFTRATTSDTTIGGHPIAKGSMIILSPWVLHRDPRVFDDPERFDPDRWLPDRVTATQRQAWIPFSGGSRKCIGNVFAMTQAVITLAAIVPRWTMRPAPGSVPRVVPKAVLVPESLHMIAHPRESPLQSG